MYSQLTGVKLDGTATDSYVTYNNNITPSTEPTSVEQIAPADNTITNPKTEDSSGAWSEPAADTASSGGW
jgi:hypothetical protein